jgi:hypothetical protein
MIQHPVGQGGLFSGTINAGGRPFRWVYDCGSNQPAALARERDKVARAGDIDMLFLSHLDSDHIVGIDVLLTQCNVREVVIPYFEKEVLFALVAQGVANGSLSTSFAQLAGDPSGWFFDRGVSQVTQVRGDDSDEGEGGPPPEPPEGGLGEGDIKSKWIPEPEYDLDAQKVGQFGQSVQVASANASVALRPSRGGLLNWALIPYVHAPPRRLMDAFRTALEGEFGVPLDLTLVRDAARSPDMRAALRRCYDALWLDHNLISMSLYSGPVTPHKGHASRMRYGLHSDMQGGWMLTGDAQLSGGRRLDRFTRHYSSVSSMVNILMLPHHGASHNFGPGLLDAFPHFHNGYAAAGPNGYGHPHPGVVNLVEDSGHFTQVSDEARDEYTLDVHLR